MYDFQEFLNPGRIWGLHPDPRERDIAQLVTSGDDGWFRIIMQFDLSTKEGFEVYRMVCEEIRNGLKATVYVKDGEKAIFPRYDKN